MLRNNGIAGFLPKPINQSELFNCMLTVMGSREDAPSAVGSTLQLPQAVAPEDALTARSSGARPIRRFALLLALGMVTAMAAGQRAELQPKSALA